MHTLFHHTDAALVYYSAGMQRPLERGEFRLYSHGGRIFLRIGQFTQPVARDSCDGSSPTASPTSRRGGDSTGGDSAGERPAKRACYRHADAHGLYTFAVPSGGFWRLELIGISPERVAELELHLRKYFDCIDGPVCEDADQRIFTTRRKGQLADPAHSQVQEQAHAQAQAHAKVPQAVVHAKRPSSQAGVRKRQAGSGKASALQRLFQRQLSSVSSKDDGTVRPAYASGRDSAAAPQTSLAQELELQAVVVSAQNRGQRVQAQLQRTPPSRLHLPGVEPLHSRNQVGGAGGVEGAMRLRVDLHEDELDESELTDLVSDIVSRHDSLVQRWRRIVSDPLADRPPSARARPGNERLLADSRLAALHGGDKAAPAPALRSEHEHEHEHEHEQGEVRGLRYVLLPAVALAAVALCQAAASAEWWLHGSALPS